MCVRLSKQPGKAAHATIDRQWKRRAHGAPVLTHCLSLQLTRRRKPPLPGQYIAASSAGTPRTRGGLAYATRYVRRGVRDERTAHKHPPHTPQGGVHGASSATAAAGKPPRALLLPEFVYVSRSRLQSYEKTNEKPNKFGLF